MPSGYCALRGLKLSVEVRNTAFSIRKAFEDVPPSKTIREIAPHECPECDELGRALLGRHYYDLPPSVIDYFYEALPLLSPQALHHYLPAWLLRALDNPGGNVIEFTVYHLSPSMKQMAEAKGYFEERFAVFDSAQRKSIRDFLHDVEDYQLWVGHEGEIERAKALWSEKGS